MSTQSDALRQVLTHASLPGQIKDALLEWVDSVEERLGGAAASPRAKHVLAHHESSRHPPKK